MPIRVLHHLALAATLCLLAAALPPGTAAAQDDPPARAVSAFQARLDRLGIPLDLPRGRAILVNVPAFELAASGRPGGRRPR